MPNHRKDIYESMKRLRKEGCKPNYAELARRFNCDYRTIKSHYENDKSEVDKTIKRKTTVLDNFKDVIKEKLDDGCTASSIYHFLKEKYNYNNSYSSIVHYCKAFKDDLLKKATSRFETVPGLQAQVDWKESKKLKTKSGEVIEFNIFLMVLGYSRMKYIELTLDRNQDTLLKTMINAFKYFGGVPHEVLHDNMRTVVDQPKTQFNKPVFNEKYYEFAKNMGYLPKVCQSYRPQTKGKVEALAKYSSLLEPYNNEFENIQELTQIVDNIRNLMNSNQSQATGEIPLEVLKKEKEYLLPLPDESILETYSNNQIKRKVPKDSMITFANKKYSVPPKYIGKILNLKIESNILSIYYNNILINSFVISDKKLNYKQEDLVNILKTDAFKFRSDEEIENFAKNQIQIYDKL